MIFRKICFIILFLISYGYYKWICVVLFSIVFRSHGHSKLTKLTKWIKLIRILMFCCCCCFYYLLALSSTLPAIIEKIKMKNAESLLCKNHSGNQSVLWFHSKNMIVAVTQKRRQFQGCKFWPGVDPTKLYFFGNEEIFRFLLIS